MHILLLFAMLIQAPVAVVEIPFELNRCGLPVVEVTVAEKSLNLVIDTGATVTTIDETFRPAEGIRIQLFLTKTRVFNLPVDFRDFSDGRDVCGKLDGLLGNDILSGAHSITLDYKHKRFILNYGEDEL